MKRKRLLFIYNPHAGKGTMKNKLSDVIETYMKADFEVTVYATRREAEATEIVLEKAAEYDRVVCSGGDGTLHEVTQGLMTMPPEARPVCGYIPTGTVNDFARGLKLPMRIKLAARVSARDKIKPVDIGQMNNRCFTYVCAFGAFTSVSYETPQAAKNLLGKTAYILQGMAQLGNIKAYHAVIQADEERIEDDFIFGMVSNAKSIGGFSFFKNRNVSLNDGLFEGVFIRKPRTPLELQAVLNSFVRLEPNEQILGFHGKRFVITSEEEIPFTLDGENGGSFKQTEIQCCHKALNYIWG